MFCYTKLWVLLVQKDITKTELRVAIGMGSATLAKMSKQKPVSLNVLAKICEYLGCNIEDIIEYKPGTLEGDNNDK